MENNKKTINNRKWVWWCRVMEYGAWAQGQNTHWFKHGQGVYQHTRMVVSKKAGAIELRPKTEIIQGKDTLAMAIMSHGKLIQIEFEWQNTRTNQNGWAPQIQVKGHRGPSCRRSPPAAVAVKNKNWNHQSICLDMLSLNPWSISPNSCSKVVTETNCTKNPNYKTLN